MNLLYTVEHLACFNYENGKKPLIELINLSKGQEWHIFPIDNKVIFVLKGGLHFSYSSYVNCYIDTQKIMILPLGNDFKAKADEDTQLFVFRIRSKIDLCDTYSLENLLSDIKMDASSKIGYLNLDDRLNGFISSLSVYYADGLHCYYFYLLKIKEFFFLLRSYYSKEDLLHFFYPLLTNDTGFSEQVFKHYQKVKTVQELAELTNYSLSGFQKRFKKVFGIPAYQWMNEQRSKSIFHEININNKSFKEISYEYGFSSPSHFNDFCKMNFGETPGKLRKKFVTKK